MSKKLGHLAVSGRWDNWVAIVDVEKALLPENDATDHAVISRPRVTPDVDCDGDGIPETPASGQPVVVTVDQDGQESLLDIDDCHPVIPATADGKVAEFFRHGIFPSLTFCS